MQSVIILQTHYHEFETLFQIFLLQLAGTMQLRLLYK